MYLVDNSVLYVYHILSPLHIVSFLVELFLQDIAFPLKRICRLVAVLSDKEFLSSPRSLGGEFAEHVSSVRPSDYRFFSYFKKLCVVIIESSYYLRS